MLKIQDIFLNNLRKQKIPVQVYSINGVPIKGRISGFDQFTIAIDTGKKQQMVFKHAVTTVVPLEPFEIPNNNE